MMVKLMFYDSDETIGREAIIPVFAALSSCCGEVACGPRGD